MDRMPWGEIGRLALAVSCGFGLGAAYVQFGFEAGLLFWAVMVLVVIVKIVVVNTFAAARKSSKQWAELLATRVPSPGLNVSQPSDRTRLARHPGTARPAPPI